MRLVSSVVTPFREKKNEVWQPEGTVLGTPMGSEPCAALSREMRSCSALGVLERRSSHPHHFGSSHFEKSNTVFPFSVFCIRRTVMVRRGWTALDVPSGWIQFSTMAIREAPHDNCGDCGTTSAAHAIAFSSHATVSSVARRGRHHGTAEGLEIGSSSADVGGRRHSRGEGHPRCSEEGESCSSGHPRECSWNSANSLLQGARSASPHWMRNDPGNWNGWMKGKQISSAFDRLWPASKSCLLQILHQRSNSCGCKWPNCSKNWVRLGKHHARNVRP